MEYEASANTSDPGMCLTKIVRGCKDDTYIEYNASANTPDSGTVPDKNCARLQR